MVLIKSKTKKEKLKMYKFGRWYKTITWHGQVKETECTNHIYYWTGTIPCTGKYICMFCGKPNEELAEKKSALVSRASTNYISNAPEEDIQRNETWDNYD